MAVGCAISWKSLSLTFLALDILVWCCHFLLIRLAPGISEFWQPFLSTALKPETWQTLLSWQVFFWCHRCLLKPMSFQPLSVDVSFPWHPYLWAFFPWDLLLLTFSSLHISFSWHGFRLAPVFLFPVKTASFDTFCLDISFVLRHFFIPTSLSFDIFVPCDAFPSTTSYYKACKKPSHSVLLHTTKLAQSASSTTSYYKACTKYFPVLLRTTKLAQSTSQYYFVLQSLHKVLPSTTSYYKACTKYFPVLLRTTTLKYFPVLLCTAKLAQNTSQHYFVLQSSHKVLPSSTSYMGTAVPEPRE